jgi:hypothetical protein
MKNDGAARHKWKSEQKVTSYPSITVLRLQYESSGRNPVKAICGPGDLESAPPIDSKEQ